MVWTGDKETERDRKTERERERERERDRDREREIEEREAWGMGRIGSGAEGGREDNRTHKGDKGETKKEKIKGEDNVGGVSRRL